MPLVLLFSCIIPINKVQSFLDGPYYILANFDNLSKNTNNFFKIVFYKGRIVQSPRNIIKALISLLLQ